MFVLPFIFITDPPAGIYIRAKLFYAFLLLLFADMAEKFHNQITIVCQLTFKTSDTVNFHLVLFFVQLSVQNAFCNQPPVSSQSTGTKTVFFFLPL